MYEDIYYRNVYMISDFLKDIVNLTQQCYNIQGGLFKSLMLVGVAFAGLLARKFMHAEMME